MPRLVPITAAIVLLAASAELPARGEEQSAPAENGRIRAVEFAGGWKLETLQLADGKTRRGIVLQQDQRTIEFLEVVQPPGKPMYLVRLPAIKLGEVAALERLNEAQREQLLRRIEHFKTRARIELGRMQDIPLERADNRRGAQWTCDGDWFRLDSTADEETTRRCMVRVEQIFLAYRQVLPPRTRERRGPLRILLFGSTDEYRGHLQRLGLNIRNPAYYSPRENLIVAGGDLTQYSNAIKQTRAENDAIRRDYEQLDEQFAARLAAIGRRLKRIGLPSEEVKREISSRKIAWTRQRAAHLRQIAEIERRNDARFDEVTQAMFRRLYHEAFHAYLKNYVYPDEETKTPHWLNEGLAQVFEDGRIDADTLRIDAPSQERLRRLQADLRGDSPLALIELLTARDNAFLATHQDNSALMLYLYAWGVAYFLAFGDDAVEQQRLDDYVAATSADLPPVDRFERLVNAPLDEFEHRWRKFILELTSAPE